MLKLLRNMKINTKLWLNAGVGLLSIFLISLFIFHITRQTDKSYREFQNTLEVADIAGDILANIRRLTEPSRAVLSDWNVVKARTQVEKILKQFQETFEELEEAFEILKKRVADEKNPKVQEALLKTEEGASNLIELSMAVFLLANEKVSAEGEGKIIRAQAAAEKAIQKIAEINLIDSTISEAMREMEMILREKTTALLKQDMADNERFSFLSFVLFSSTLIVTLLVSFLNSKSVSRQVNMLQEMVRAVSAISAGNLNYQLQVQGHGEIGEFAKAFSKMVIGLRGVVSGIHEGSGRITSVANQMVANTKKVNDGAIHQSKASEKTASSIAEIDASLKNIAESVDSLSSSAETTSSSLTEMSAAISQVAGSALHLSSFVEDSTAAILEMSSSIKQVAENVNQLSSNAEETTSSIMEMNTSIKQVEENAKESAHLTEMVSRDATELGSGAIEKTIQGMERIKETVEKSSTVIHKLDERTAHIGKILTVIDDVTRETNLLALNAAILAAQAGSEGKGFAVVADEIKSLADRTATSTREIVQLIHDVQSETKGAVASINQGLESVKEGARLSILSRESIQKILESSKRSSEMSRQIEKATLEQAQATHQVTKLMEKVNVMIRQVNRAMQEQEKSTAHISDAAEKMRSITRQVKISTEEQAQGSKQINQAMENVTMQIQQIARAMSEQKRGNEVIQKAITEIHQVTQLSVEMVGEMNQAAEGLILQADSLNGQVNHFKV